MLTDIEKEQKQKEREMYEALNPKKNRAAPLAPSTSSSYNNIKEASGSLGRCKILLRKE